MALIYVGADIHLARTGPNLSLGDNAGRAKSISKFHT